MTLSLKQVIRLTAIARISKMRDIIEYAWKQKNASLDNTQPREIVD